MVTASSETAYETSLFNMAWSVEFVFKVWFGFGEFVLNFMQRTNVIVFRLVFSPLRAACKAPNALLDPSLDAPHQHIGLHLLVNHLASFRHFSVPKLFVLLAPLLLRLARLPLGSETFLLHTFHLWLFNFSNSYTFNHIFDNLSFFISSIIEKWLCHGWFYALWQQKFFFLCCTCTCSLNQDKRRSP